MGFAFALLNRYWLLIVQPLHLLVNRGKQSALRLVIGVQTFVVRASLGHDIGKYFASADKWRQSFVSCLLVTSLIFLALAAGCGVVRVRS